VSDYEIFRPRRATRWQRFIDSARSITLGPWNPKDPAIARYFGGTPVSSGVSVNEGTAMTSAAVWQAVTLISSHVATVPLLLYKRLSNGGKERYEGHPLYRLLQIAPNPEMSSFTFRETLQGHLLLWGNAYAEIERDGSGRPAALWPLLPWMVTPTRDTPGSPLAYRVTNPSGNDVIIPAVDMLHIRGLGDDTILGHSVIQKARESIGLGLATEKFGATFFGNGASMGGVVSVSGPRPDPKTEKGHRDQLEARHQGVERAHRLLVLYNDAKFTQNVIPPEDAQFLQTRMFQVEEIARWFNLPPHKLKHLERSTYSNIEHQGIEYVTDTLLPWFRRWEGELNRKLIAPLEQNIQFVEFLIEGLLRGDAAGRAAFYKTMREIGAMSANEIRIRENLNPVEGGDALWTQRPAATNGQENS